VPRWSHRLLCALSTILCHTHLLVQVDRIETEIMEIVPGMRRAEVCALCAMLFSSPNALRLSNNYRPNVSPTGPYIHFRKRPQESQ
jgi:hypothetical protein